MANGCFCPSAARPPIKTISLPFVRCGECRYEFLLAFSCKGGYFCPSCHQKRVASFAEWAEQEVLEKVPHRQYVFTIPKMLRIYFKYDRKLLGKLSRCAYETVKEFFQEVVPDNAAVPGVILSIQTYGEELNYHPHLHAVITDGCFSREGTFHPIREADTQKMMELFRHKVFKMLLAEEKITATQVEKLLAWRHTGFSVYRGEKVEAEDKKGREHLASYILHPPLSQEKMSYDPQTGTVQYRVKKKKGLETTETFSALDWLARLSAHIPDKWEQMVYYYGWYSNRMRGDRKKKEQKDSDQPIEVINPDSESEFKKQCRRNWARLIKRVYEVDPLLCPQCGGKMKIISFIEDPAMVKRILTHLGFWQVVPRAKRAPPKPPPEITLDYDLF